MTKTDIKTLADIQLLVNTFYAKVQQDDLIGPIFNAKIQDNWTPHLEKMYRFWQTILLETHTYSGSPFPPHKHLPVNQVHFDRWMQLFSTTVNTLFEGKIADEAKFRAEKMAEMFLYKIDYFKREAQENPLLNTDS